MKHISLLMTLVIFFSSCAHVIPKSKFNPDRVDLSKEGIFYGKLKVVYDEVRTASNNCALNFVDSNKKKITVNLDRQGNFMSSASSGQVYLSNIICKHGVFNFKDKEIVFNNIVDGKPNFVGDIEMKWTAGSINPFLLIGGLLIGWIAIAQSPDTIKIKNMSENSRSIASLGDHHKSLIKIPYGLK